MGNITLNITWWWRNGSECIFYTLMNAGGVNAPMLYKFSSPAKAPKHRRVFLKKTAFTLMKEHLIIRSNLPQDISDFLKVNYGQDVESITRRKTCIGEENILSINKVLPLPIGYMKESLYNSTSVCSREITQHARWKVKLFSCTF